MDTSERGSTACDDGVDNDGDGLADYHVYGLGDPDCSWPGDDSEQGACARPVPDEHNEPVHERTVDVVVPQGADLGVSAGASPAPHAR